MQYFTCCGPGSRGAICPNATARTRARTIGSTAGLGEESGSVPRGRGLVGRLRYHGLYTTRVVLSVPSQRLPDRDDQVSAMKRSGGGWGLDENLKPKSPPYRRATHKSSVTKAKWQCWLSAKLVCDALDRASPDVERLGHLAIQPSAVRRNRACSSEVAICSALFRLPQS